MVFRREDLGGGYKGGFGFGYGMIFCRESISSSFFVLVIIRDFRVFVRIRLKEYVDEGSCRR